MRNISLSQNIGFKFAISVNEPLHLQLYQQPYRYRKICTREHKINDPAFFGGRCCRPTHPYLYVVAVVVGITIS